MGYEPVTSFGWLGKWQWGHNSLNSELCVCLDSGHIFTTTHRFIAQIRICIPDNSISSEDNEVVGILYGWQFFPLKLNLCRNLRGALPIKILNQISCDTIFQIYRKMFAQLFKMNIKGALSIKMLNQIASVLIFITFQIYSICPPISSSWILVTLCNFIYAFI